MRIHVEVALLGVCASYFDQITRLGVAIAVALAFVKDKAYVVTFGTYNRSNFGGMLRIQGSKHLLNIWDFLLKHMDLITLP